MKSTISLILITFVIQGCIFSSKSKCRGIPLTRCTNSSLIITFSKEYKGKNIKVYIDKELKTDTTFYSDKITQVKNISINSFYELEFMNIPGIIRKNISIEVDGKKIGLKTKGGYCMYEISIDQSENTKIRNIKYYNTIW